MSDKHTPGPWSSGLVMKKTTLAAHERIYMPGACAAGVWSMGCDRETVEANAILIAAAPDLLDELRKAHQIVRNALAVMTTEQKSEWGRLNERDAVDGEGITRANERQSVIARAEAFHA